MIGWSLSPDKPESDEGPREWRRSEDSFYVHCSAKRYVWRIEFPPIEQIPQEMSPSDLQGKFFKLAYYAEDQPQGSSSAHTQPLYLAMATDMNEDVR